MGTRLLVLNVLVVPLLYNRTSFSVLFFLLSSFLFCHSARRMSTRYELQQNKTFHLTDILSYSYQSALFFHSYRFFFIYLYIISTYLSISNNMLESELIITFDNDDEIINTKNTESNPSSNSSKTKRTRLTFPFGAW